MTLIAAIIVIIFAVALYGYRSNKRVWNRGVCRESGRQWVYFDTDSQGGRGYVDDANWGRDTRMCWISWPVDK